MAYSAAHLSELGITLWRLRSDVPEAEQAAVVDSGAAQQTEAPPVQAPVRAEARAAPAAENLRPTDPDAQVTAQQQQDAIDQQEALALRRTRIARMDWQALQNFVGQQSREGAQQAVFGVGAQDADLMVIGEAPGAEEDKQGEPFVGRAGQLLDQMLQAIQCSRSKNVYIANICKFRPPNNRDPRPEEVAEDLPYLLRQIELVQPRALLAVGRIAAQNLLDCTDPIGRMRGRQFEFGERRIPTLVTYHPA